MVRPGRESVVLAKQEENHVLHRLAKSGRAILEDLPIGGLAYVAARDLGKRRLVVVCPSQDDAAAFAQDFMVFSGRPADLMLADDHTPFAAMAPDARAAFGRFAWRHRARFGEQPQVTVVNAAVLQGRWLDEATFAGACRRLQVGEAVDRVALAAHLVFCGYQPVSLVEDEGTFAVRGGIIDIFVPGRAQPVRIDLFGDELASIKTFDPQTQKTSAIVGPLGLFPIREVLFDDATVGRAQAFVRRWGEQSAVPTKKLRALAAQIDARHYFFGIESLWPAFYTSSEPILDALLSGETTIVVQDADVVRQCWRARDAQAAQEREKAVLSLGPQVDIEAHVVAAEHVVTALADHPQVHAVRLHIAAGKSDVLRLPLHSFASLATAMQLKRQRTTHDEMLAPLLALLRRRQAQHADLFLACSSRGQAERLREMLLAYRVHLPVWDRLPDVASWGTPSEGCYGICVAPLQAGIDDRGRGAGIVTEAEMFGHQRPPPRPGRPKATPQALTTLQQLQPGDAVIHQDHGIARYRGLVRLFLNGVDGDYVHLEYADGDKLYLPVFRIALLQPYRGPGDTVRLDKLGGQRWERAQARVRDAVLAVAHQLLALQARRQSQPGFALSPPSPDFLAFEAAFPFEETPDQRRAIEAVLADLQKDTPMDRLVCGDVGFGKTEVAMRAAFLAAMGGRQVAVLVPTTVLAEQHGASFSGRMASHGVQVEVLSRFRAPKDVRQVLRRVALGQVDVVIGTHRLLSHDVAFKNLGLLVVDEEQRFGVKNKERIKQLRAHVHVLTLSATPIPRTLHMASVGLRDLSIIQTPPAQRTAIRTEVVRFDADVIAQALRRELHRGGQAFIVHNRVASIAHMAERIGQWVPEARVGVAHGQMGADALERVMVDFVRRRYDVLVCTAIIESGIDIPSANTMVVDRADTFGLSQLYQLRGRIGRGRERAYAYLMLPAEEVLTREASERLAVLKRFGELGAGFQIASHDLELRGAGDLLGANQSGHIAAVGFELYVQLLGEAVECARGQRAGGAAGRSEVEPEIKVPVVAVLPETYVPEPMQRLAAYQRLAQAKSDAAIFDIVADLVDVYGPAPASVHACAEVMVIRRRLVALGADSLAATVDPVGIRVAVGFVAEAAVDRDALVQRCQKEPGTYRLLASGRLVLTLPPLTPEVPKAVAAGDQGDTDTRTGDTALLRAVREAVGQLPRTVHAGGT